MKSIGIFGGTFSPIHNGHLRMALELKQHLALDEMRLLPAHQPPHRTDVRVSSLQRLDMVRLAVEDCDDLSVDDRELFREGCSYSVETLESFRKELGDDTSLVFCMGMDSFLSLPSWHRWEDILELAHIAVAARPGWELPETGELPNLLSKRGAEKQQLSSNSHGSIVIDELTLLPISATAIRREIQNGLSPCYLVPQNVWRYIQKNKLYSENQ